MTGQRYPHLERHPTTDWQLAPSAIITDGLPADATFVFDPLADRLAAVFDGTTGALVRQLIVTAASERVDKQDLLDIVAKELRNTYLGPVAQAMDESGVLDALDEAPDITFPNLRRSAIPDEDLELLRHAGVDDPEAMITIIIHYSRKHVGGPDTRPSSVVERANNGLREAADMLSPGDADVPQQQPEKKKRKILNGVGKILAGAITGAGNLLLFGGTIVAPNPGTAYAVIGSSALAVGSICQGLGDLRGEG